jgi:hypothetical protein
MMQKYNDLFMKEIDKIYENFYEKLKKDESLDEIMRFKIMDNVAGGYIISKYPPCMSFAIDNLIKSIAIDVERGTINNAIKDISLNFDTTKKIIYSVPKLKMLYDIYFKEFIDPYKEIVAIHMATNLFKYKSMNSDFFIACFEDMTNICRLEFDAEGYVWTSFLVHAIYGKRYKLFKYLLKHFKNVHDHYSNAKFFNLIGHQDEKPKQFHSAHDAINANKTLRAMYDISVLLRNKKKIKDPKMIAEASSIPDNFTYDRDNSDIEFIWDQ